MPRTNRRQAAANMRVALLAVTVALAACDGPAAADDAAIATRSKAIDSATETLVDKRIAEASARETAMTAEPQTDRPARSSDATAEN